MIKTFFLLLLLDQISKKIVLLQNLPHQNNPGIFSIHLPPILLIILSTVFLLSLFFWLIKAKKQSDSRLAFALLLIISGGLSNFLDRFTSAFVIDWIYLPFFPHFVFNLADVYITLSLLLVLIH